MLTVAIITEQYDNTHHAHVATEPPRRGTWASLSELLSECMRRYGTLVSLHYRDIGEQRAVPLGWIFDKDGPNGVLETWVSIVDAETLKYRDLRTLE